jgi:hypothetical protein
MLGRNDHTRGELERTAFAVGAQLVAYRNLMGAGSGRSADTETRSALEDFEGLYLA